MTATGDAKSPPGSPAALVVGYGNPLLGDDGVGPAVAEALWSSAHRWPALSGTTFTWAHQLAPEMAADVATSHFVVFVDAASDGRPPGSVTTCSIAPLRAGPGQAAAGAVGCWQDLSPAALLALASQLYGAAPPAALVTVSVSGVEVGQDLSPAVHAALPEAVATVRHLVEERAGA